jgi:hypothetical protein
MKEIEPELSAEMTLFPPEPNQSAANRPSPVVFTREELEAAAENNPWVKVNIVVPQTANRRITKKPRIYEAHCVPIPKPPIR